MTRLPCGEASTVVHVSEGPSVHAEWWTTSDVASYLGVDVRTVSAYRSRKQIPPPDQTLGRRTHLWRPARIIEWNRARPRRGESAHD